MLKQPLSRVMAWSLLVAAGVVGAGLGGVRLLVAGVSNRQAGVFVAGVAVVVVCLVFSGWALRWVARLVRDSSTQWPSVMSGPMQVGLRDRVTGVARMVVSSIMVVLAGGVLAGGLSVVAWWLAGPGLVASDVRLAMGVVGLGVALITAPS